MSYDRNHGISSGACVTFDLGDNISHLDCRSIVLNDQENYLILVGHHALKLIHFDELTYSMINNLGDEHSMFLPYESNLQTIQLFNPCNVNRPIVQWNHHNNKQFALAVDRLVRFYSIEDGQVHETDTIINTQHQRPISTISYWPYDPHALLTGSFDGQVQLWDIRHCSSKSPANLKIIIPTPFTVRHIQWPSIGIDHTNSTIDTNQLAIQCDRCVRIYDMRRPDNYLSSIEHQQRVMSMDWTKQKQSVVTHSMDNSIKVFSTHGQMLAESLVNEITSAFTIGKVHTTTYDNLMVTSARDINSSIYGFVGWRWDDDQHLRPLSDQILTTTTSPIVDFTLLKNSRFSTLFQQISSARPNNSALEHLPILAWCQDEKLRLIEMDFIFRQTYHELMRIKQRALVQAQTLANFPRLMRTNRRTSNSKTMMDVIEDETSRSEESDCDDISLHDLSSSKALSIELSETDDDDVHSFSSDHSLHLPSTVTIKNEFNSIQDTYGPHITIEMKDEQRRFCILRCLYPLDNRKSFRIYLFLSRHYPIVSKLSVRFKLSAQYNCDERLKTFQHRIQGILDETSFQCFYHGQLCLHICLLKLKHFFQSFLKKEQNLSNRPIKKSKKKRHRSSHSMDLDTSLDLNRSRTSKNVSIRPMFDLSFSSPRQQQQQQQDETQCSSTPSIRANPRPCGARFAGPNHLICFGRSIALQTEPVSAPPIMNTSNDKLFRRPNPFHFRSTSLSVPKTRQSFNMDEPLPSYRASISSTKTVQIQGHSSRRRTSLSSAPVRFSLGSSVDRDQQRLSNSSVSFHRRHSNPLTSNSTISIYDLSILLPVNKKLADEYKIDLDDPLDMCDENQKITEKMAKDELTHCWHLLRGLLQMQSTLPMDHAWFESPIARGLIEYLVSRYVAEGDVQSASMFLLTMLKTPYMKDKTSLNSYTDQSYHPILYAYASLLHRWKHFYKRTQVFQGINRPCSSTSMINGSSSLPLSQLNCSLCSQPIRGQHFLCGLCGHAGHLTHIHQWFSSSNLKHRYCPEKDCTCRCMIKQQELLTTYNNQMQQHQHTPTVGTPRSYSFRQIASGNTTMSVRP